jgi:zinc transport system substrate-binding protein
LALTALAFVACGRKAPPEVKRGPDRNELFTVYAVSYPLSYFAERIAPDGVQVLFPVPEGIDPAFWTPSAEEIQPFQAAGLILLNGAGYARWTNYATLPEERVVVTADGCRERFLESEDDVRHQHGPEGTHAHSGRAFTTWLAFRLAVCQASRIRDAFVERLPEHERAISERFEALERDLLDFDARLREVGKAAAGQTLLASHPVYQYLADAYALSIESLHLEPEQQLSQEDWRTLDTLLERHRAKWMLWEGAPLESTQSALAARGVSVIVFSPTGQKPAEGDFLRVMRENLLGLECATGVIACP